MAGIIWLHTCMAEDFLGWIWAFCGDHVSMLMTSTAADSVRGL
jgi:hypothetical protein